LSLRGHLADKKVWQFQNVPFAKLERFEKPKPYGSWGEEVWDGTQQTTAVPQSNFLRDFFQNVTDTFAQLENDSWVMGDQPCVQDESKLSLQVFTPPFSAETKTRPVMVFIHGGAWQFGSAGMVNGQALAAHGDVVVVAISYRLSILGFLFENWGLFDQLEALKWVQANIGSYCGDADNVTIFGESAGSWSVESHLVSNKSAGLFHRAICQSGCLKTNAFRFGNEWKNKTSIAKLMELTKVDSIDSLKETLKLKTTDEITELMDILTKEQINVEATFDNDFFTENPATAPYAQKVPVLIGHNSTESSGMLAEFLPGLRDGYTKESAVASLTAMYKRPQAEITAALEQATKVYDFDENDKMAWSKLVCFWFADEIFFGANMRANEQLDKQSIYLYNLDVQLKMYHEDPWKGASEKVRADFCRSDHADDLGLMFGYSFIDDDLAKGKKYTPEEVELSARMMTAWSDFARSGQPGFDEFKISQLVHCYSAPADFTQSVDQKRLKRWNDAYYKTKI